MQFITMLLPIIESSYDYSFKAFKQYNLKIFILTVFMRFSHVFPMSKVFLRKQK